MVLIINIKNRFLSLFILIAIFLTILNGGQPSEAADKWINISEHAKPAIVIIVAGDNGTYSLGSGFFVNPEGYIVTNAHVVNTQDRVNVRLYDDQIFVASVVHTDDLLDLALLKIPVINLPTLRLGASGNVKDGEAVIAIGAPLGFNYTVTSGIVSSPNRTIDDIKYVQTDVSINPGNSGGPLINLSGEVLGVNTFIYENVQGMGFAIQIDQVISFLNEQGVAVETSLTSSMATVQPIEISDQQVTDQIIADEISQNFFYWILGLFFLVIIILVLVFWFKSRSKSKKQIVFNNGEAMDDIDIQLK